MSAGDDDDSTLMVEVVGVWKLKKQSKVQNNQVKSCFFCGEEMVERMC